jgi:hypothetical protein
MTTTLISKYDTRPPDRTTRWWRVLHRLDDMRHRRKQLARDLARLDRAIAEKEAELSALVLKE